ncbi:hypothetical protein [Dragonfly-associated microphage 1]|uniref:hypothetical protein n=1 Tax=Dragonfly-associated microphage 1 TaxID=1234888 RepID=UPI00028BAC4E|nr:hypothetical protein [Dragonfly-associated microphage 1]AFS65321.1 hypothetical protein [Dragonfly-associated microphage 1]
MARRAPRRRISSPVQSTFTPTSQDRATPARWSSRLAWLPRSNLTAVTKALADQVFQYVRESYRPGPRAMVVYRPSQKRLSRRSRVDLLRPVVRPNKSRNFCQLRRERKEVMFARGVAGGRWGRRGPDMYRASRTAYSNLTCRR